MIYPNAAGPIVRLIKGFWIGGKEERKLLGLLDLDWGINPPLQPHIF